VVYFSNSFEAIDSVRCNKLDQPMKIEHDREVDALYVRLQEKYVARTIEIEEGLNLDLDEDGKLIGLEVLDATEKYSLADIFNVATENLIFEREIAP
jgi:uncharacterized protein YuzE